MAEKLASVSKKTTSYYRGLDLFNNGMAVPETESVNYWYFVVRSDTGCHFYFVKIRKDTLVDNCCCEHGSQWRFKKNIKPQICKHRWACRIWLKEHRGIEWNNVMQ